MPTKVGRSSTAEEELKLLAQRPALQSAVSTMNLTVLKKRFKCSDIFPKVTVELIRDQDREKDARVDLAYAVAQTMATELAKLYSGSKEKSKLVLRVNITVVSDGCCKQRNAKIANLLRQGINQGKGMAKLTASYCLFRRKTGKVAVAKQLSKTKEPSCEDSKAAVMELEEELRQMITKEVTFSCCSRLAEWNQESKRMISTRKINSRTKTPRKGRREDKKEKKSEVEDDLDSTGFSSGVLTQ